MNRKILRIIFLLFLSVTVLAQNTRFSRDTRSYILYDSQITALKYARLIKGDGSPPVSNQTVIIENGKIKAMGDSDKLQIPTEAEIIDLAGKSLMPGLIMLHEHMFYPAGAGHYNQQSISFPRLYLAGGVTFIRTAGSIEPYSDLNLKKAIQVATWNGAQYLELESELGTIETGKIADLIVVNGNPDSRIQDIRKIEVVFKDGVGFDSQKLFASVKGTVGLR